MLGLRHEAIRVLLNKQTYAIVLRIYCLLRSVMYHSQELEQSIPDCDAPTNVHGPDPDPDPEPPAAPP
jgi:hypothetical protein